MTSAVSCLPRTRPLRRWQASLGTAIAALLSLSLPTAAPADENRISGPHAHENLAVYLIHGPSASGPVPLTLQEAIAKDAVRVVETGSVNQLEIENIGTEDVFVQAGDIVKGGKQDRVLTISMLLTPATGKIGIGAFCVEQGRWSARGSEDVKRFASADAALPSREAKLAMLLPAKPAPEPTPIGPTTGARVAGLYEQRQAALPDDTSTRQRDVWAKVRSTQDKLSGSLGAAVAAPQSQSSLQLSLENERLKKAQQAFVAALRPVAEKDADVVGFVVAVNGKLSSADVYPSHGLFRKMWAKQLNASVTEAIGETASQTAATPSDRPAAPTLDAVKAFLAGADKGKASERLIAGRMKLETRDADEVLLVQASRADGSFVHRNYLAK